MWRCLSCSWLQDVCNSCPSTVRLKLQKFETKYSPCECQQRTSMDKRNERRYRRAEQQKQADLAHRLHTLPQALFWVVAAKSFWETGNIGSRPNRQARHIGTMMGVLSRITRIAAMPRDPEGSDRAIFHKRKTITQATRSNERKQTPCIHLLRLRYLNLCSSSPSWATFTGPMKAKLYSHLDTRAKRSQAVNSPGKLGDLDHYFRTG